MSSPRNFLRSPLPSLLVLAIFSCGRQAPAQTEGTGDPVRGKAYFQQNCALCHADNAEIAKQGPSLVGVVGRRAASTPGFSYTSALTQSGLTWDPATLDRFLAAPTTVVPGTAMVIAVSKPEDRQDVVAYLSTLKAPSVAAVAAAPAPPRPDGNRGESPVPTASSNDLGAWQNAAPGVQHHITLADLPKPFATRSVGNGPRTVKQPANATLSVPAGFSVRLFASGLSNPRLLRVAPNGDIFIAETSHDRLRVLRAADGAETPEANEVYVEGLNRPFGLAFYPPGDDPQWIYVANNNSVVRLPYHNGDLKATGAPEVVVPHLTDSGGGHSTP